MKPYTIVAALALGSLTVPLAAESASAPFQARSSSSSSANGDPFEQFVPAAQRKDHRIDYAHWDEALEWFVIPMGPSLRQGARRPDAGTGTRFVYGHDSRYRLEGNRVAFSFLSPQIRNALTEYRKDLEQVGSSLDISTLPRNEQLAFWINLHNVAVVEAVALEYPMREPAKRTFGTNNATLQDAKLVTIGGIDLSPRDIREKIVYPNWKDPKVIYAFWRGEIGGPSIQRTAFTGANVDFLLSLGAEEFVNSLRGIESFGGALQVSKIYQEAEPFYFQDREDLRAHLAKFARDDVKKLIAKKDRIAFNRYESDIADMLYGRGDPGLTWVCVQGRGGEGIPTNGASAVGLCSDEPVVTDRAAKRLMLERAQKLNRAWRRGIRTGTVIFGNGDFADGETPKEVE